MKKKILTLGMVLTLVAVLVAPNAVLAVTTEVTGTVTEGYTFTAPSTVALGSMAPSATAYKAHSTDGRLDGNNAYGYTVFARDDAAFGYMRSGGNWLIDMLDISNEDANYEDAHPGKMLLLTDGITGADISLYVRQIVTYADPVADGYTMTISFTVAALTP